MELSDKVTRDLRDITDKKKEEIEGEEAFQAKFGTRTPSQVCAALWKDANNYQTYHNQAVSISLFLCMCLYFSCYNIDYRMFHCSVEIQHRVEGNVWPELQVSCPPVWSPGVAAGHGAQNDTHGW